jgi:hypothetical protein
MRKIFLIPLMTLVCSVMAWADNEAKIGTTEYATLKAALDAASSGATVELLKDVSYTDAAGTANLNINKSLTLDGKGHTISGYSKRSGKSQWATIWINLVSPSASNVTVIFKDVKVINPKSGSNTWAIHTRGKIDSVAVVDSYLAAYMTPFQVGGSQATKAKITMINSQLYTPAYYCVCSYNPYIMKLENCQFEGWNALYFKGVDGSAGSRGSEVTANNCKFNCPNYNSGTTNSFGMFVFEDDGISVSLNNCSMDAEQFGDQYQWIAVLSSWGVRREQAVNLSISGDNTYINGLLMKDSWARGDYSYWEGSKAIYTYGEYEVPSPHPLSITISGGTYNFNPATTGWYKDATLEEPDLDDESNIALITIPDGYEVKEIETQQGEYTTTLWRVRQIITGSTALNDNAGQNPTADIKVSDNVTLANEETIAEYVEVKGGESTDPKVTVTVPEGKTLEVTNGLDVTGNAEVVVEAGSTVVVGEGGIISEKPENIVIQADENGAASLLLDPKVVVNTTPNLTVKMKAKQIGWINMLGEKHYFWHRFALPIQEAATWVKDPNKSTYVFGWNYTNDSWEQLSALTQMVPFKGYTLSADYENLGDIEYTFTGQLAGNTNNALNFERNGFNFFGNSYTGYIDVLALVDQIMGDNKIDGTVWMWYQENQSYVAIPLQALRDDPTAFDSWMREVAPMQTFIMKQNGSENASAELNYASAVWGNPRYGNNSGSGAGAPRRAEVDETTRMRIIVKAENGKSDFVMLTENAKYSDAFEKGYDGEKYMNENALNMYATVEGANYSAVATDNLEGKMITINTVEAVNYTMSFAKVNGEEYAIRDNVTGNVIVIEEGATYEFAAQPNSLVENRFEIVAAAKVPTAIENAAVKANAKGIYTIMGQYLGEDFNALPAGIYVVNGVKIVK